MSLIFSRYATSIFSFLLISFFVSEVVAQGVLIGLPNRRDHVYDSLRDILYISTSDGAVERYDVSTGTFFSSFTTPGTSYNGIAISRDFSSIYVADANQGAGQGVFRKYDTATGTRTNLFYDQAFGEGEAWDIEVTNAGFAVATTEYNGSGWTPMRELDVSSDTYSEGIRRVRQRTHLHASADGSKILYLESNSSAGPFGIYDSATGTFTASSIGSTNSSRLAAANRNGSHFAIEVGSAISIVDESLESIELLGGITGGIGFNPVYDVFYGVDVSTDEVVAYNTSDYVEFDRFPIGEDVTGGSIFDDGIMSFSGDGSKLFLSTPSGIRMITVAEPVLFGDVNLDDEVNFLDVSPFISLLSGETFQAEADCDFSGTVDFLDITAFIAILNGS